MKHEINDKVLPNLKEEDLKDMKGLSIGARVTFMTWLKSYIAQLEPPTEATYEEKESNECVICCCCYENMANMAFMPCGHVSMCEQCTQKCENKNVCSVCKGPGRACKIYLVGV